MTPLPAVIVYAYAASPMWQKLKNVLLIKRIPYSIVDVGQMPPRPPLLQLGITYRRIPVIAIGNDLIFDTALMVTELERVFTPENGHPALLSSHQGLQEIASFYWADRTLFGISASFIPGNKVPEVFKKDRLQFNPAMDFDAMERVRPAMLSTLRTHLHFLTTQLSTSNSPFLLGTAIPSYIDISAFTLIAWAKSLRAADSILVLPSSKAPVEYRRAMEWFEAMEAALKAASSDISNPAAKPKLIGGDAAAAILASGDYPSAVSIDSADPVISFKWFTLGDKVEVTPNDTGKVPQVGELVGLNAQTTTIRVPIPDSSKSLLAHFPRLGYTIKKVSSSSGKQKGKL